MEAEEVIEFLQDEHDYHVFNKTQEEIIKALSERPMIRRELVKKTKTARTTIYDNLFKLKKRGIVGKRKIHNGKKGRPLEQWFLHEN